MLPLVRITKSLPTGRVLLSIVGLISLNHRAVSNSLIPIIGSVASAAPTLTLGEAIAKAEAYLNAKWDEFPSSLEYFSLDNDHAVLT